ncbi:MAG: antibiotic biosynthesis monooxygenase [Anaerolineales bacterium]|nr:antibiotic biosynthesis monooxygenase [Anaerolineales bacterium]
MIYVLASIRVKEGEREAFLKVFKANVPAVRAESGCIAYQPTVDFLSGFSSQELDPGVVTVLETWESLDHLKAHLKAPHMLTYRKQTKDMVLGTTLKVLQEA